MIDTVFDFLQKELNQYLTDNAEAIVECPKEEPGDSVQLPLDRIVPLLIRIEEEKTVRFDDRYIRTHGSATNPDFTTAPPAVPLHLYVFFIARFKDYKTGLKHLSAVIRFFQARPLLQPPGLPEVATELHTPTFTVQNEIWGALKAPQHPAVLYKLTMLLLEEDTVTSDKVVQTVQTRLIAN